MMESHAKKNFSNNTPNFHKKLIFSFIFILLLFLLQNAIYSVKAQTVDRGTYVSSYLTSNSLEVNNTVNREFNVEYSDTYYETSKNLTFPKSYSGYTYDSVNNWVCYFGLNETLPNEIYVKNIGFTIHSFNSTGSEILDYSEKSNVRFTDYREDSVGDYQNVYKIRNFFSVQNKNPFFETATKFGYQIDINFTISKYVEEINIQLYMYLQVNTIANGAQYFAPDNTLFNLLGMGTGLLPTAVTILNYENPGYLTPQNHIRAVFPQNGLWTNPSYAFMHLSGRVIKNVSQDSHFDTYIHGYSDWDYLGYEWHTYDTNRGDLEFDVIHVSGINVSGVEDTIYPSSMRNATHFWVDFDVYIDHYGVTVNPNDVFYFYFRDSFNHDVGNLTYINSTKYGNYITPIRKFATSGNHEALGYNSSVEYPDVFYSSIEGTLHFDVPTTNSTHSIVFFQAAGYIYIYGYGSSDTENSFDVNYTYVANEVISEKTYTLDPWDTGLLSFVNLGTGNITSKFHDFDVGVSLTTKYDSSITNNTLNVMGIIYCEYYVTTTEPYDSDNILDLLPIAIVYFTIPVTVSKLYGKKFLGLALIGSTAIIAFGNMVSIEYIILLLIISFIITFYLLKNERID